MKTPKPPEYCYVLVILEDGKARLSIGTASGPCAQAGGVQTPKCTPVQMWERAIADGAPTEAKFGTANMMGRWWVFSTPGDDSSHDIKNDCE